MFGHKNKWLCRLFHTANKYYINRVLTAIESVSDSSEVTSESTSWLLSSEGNCSDASFDCNTQCDEIESVSAVSVRPLKNEVTLSIEYRSRNHVVCIIS